MSVAIAGTRRRRHTRRDLSILGLAILAHALVLLALVMDAHWTPVMVEPPVFQVELLQDAKPAESLISIPGERTPTPPVPRRTVAPSAPPTTPTVAAGPAKPAGVVAPPGFTARQLVEESDATRNSVRDSLKCRHEKTAALTKTERNACAEADGQRSRTAPLYAAIDPDKKAFFDGDCDKDDEWCLYRIGKGPYPGIFALGKKKKHKGWDD